MTNPDRDELVKLADTITGHVASLANEPLRMPLTTWNVVSNDILAAAESLRRLASFDGDAVERVASYLASTDAFHLHYRGFAERNEAAKFHANAILATGLVPDETNKIIYENKNDGFIGVCIGEYKTLEGEKGKVLQQLNTKIVHVYRDKWLNKVGYQTP